MTFVFEVNSLRAVAKTFFVCLSQKRSSGAIGGIDRNCLNCYLIMLIAVSIQGKNKRPCAVEEIPRKGSVLVFLSVQQPAVPLGNSLPVFRPNFPPL